MSTFSTRRADQVTVGTRLVVVQPGTDVARFRTVQQVSLVGDDVTFRFFETDCEMMTSQGNEVDVFNG